MKIMGVFGDFAQSIADHATESLPYCPECVLSKRNKYVGVLSIKEVLFANNKTSNVCFFVAEWK